MNKAKLKSYAPQARKDFIAAVTARANLLGLSERSGTLDVAASQPQGDATVIAGQAWPIKVHSQRQQLITRIQKDGFTQTMEAVAYTWFNRFAALRYMELHDYLGHGHRALSSVEGTLPDILTHAADLAQSGASEGGLPGLIPSLVVEMKLAGNRDGELYRLLLVAQCNALSNVMPFLFERIDDETELLLPDNLLRTDSVIAKLVTVIDEEDWKEVEIIGWLYQFYISEKKDEVIGAVVKSEDIPAATQLFTPNWIVQYLVQNSVGRLWLMANPASTLKEKWPYYIAPADQTPEVQTQLNALIQARIDEDGDSLNPETITMLDPACGSGHILVEAYGVLKAIYLERGYQPRSIPRLILEKNLYGLDIDDRAAQMAGFALMMKARADDRRLFSEPVKLNVLSLQESKGMDADELNRALETVASFSKSQTTGSAASSEFVEGDLFPGTQSAPQMEGALRPAIVALVAIFSHAKTFGSLIQIPPALSVQLVPMALRLQLALQNGDLYAKAAAEDLLPLLLQAKVLAMQIDAVVANPPYMSSNGMNATLKSYAKASYPETKQDLFAMFIERGFRWCKTTGFNSMVTMQSWMFLSSFESMRKKIIAEKTISTFIQIGYNSFPEMNSKVAQACAFSIVGKNVKEFSGSYFDLNSVGQSADKNLVFLERRGDRNHQICQSEFDKIPGSPIAYWVSALTRTAFGLGVPLREIADPRKGMVTANNPRFIRMWYEVSRKKIAVDCYSRQNALESQKKWFPYQKGGSYKKWFGNNESIVNWESDGKELLNLQSEGYKVGSTNHNLEYIFQPAIVWTKITSSAQSFRYATSGYLFDDASGLCPVKDKSREFEILGFLNSKVSMHLLKATNPTLNLNPGNLADLPISGFVDGAKDVVEECVRISALDWDCFENSWSFSVFSLASRLNGESLQNSWEFWQKNRCESIQRLLVLEQKNNEHFIRAYGLQDEIPFEVLEPEITIARADRERDCQRLLSYAIGCMMGRYSLDTPGLIYADAGNVGFDATQYASFPADADGIVPLTDQLWFEDEAASRIREFLLVVWGADTLAENMAWLAESLGIKAGETSDETIRRYLADKFYNDHLQTYKKRPIYWLFSSGKQGAFQALVYLHRYHEGTLARMRAEYVVPLTGKIQSRINMLEKDVAAASSTAARNKLAKEVEKLKRKHVELLAYDEQLRHHADMRITLDLDDGVKVNYGKFGDLLAEVKAVTGGASDD